MLMASQSFRKPQNVYSWQSTDVLTVLKLLSCIFVTYSSWHRHLCAPPHQRALTTTCKIGVFMPLTFLSIDCRITHEILNYGFILWASFESAPFLWTQQLLLWRYSTVIDRNCSRWGQETRGVLRYQPRNNKTSMTVVMMVIWRRGERIACGVA